MEKPETNASRALAYFVEHVLCLTPYCGDSEDICAECVARAEKLERLLDESEDRGMAAAQLATPRGPFQMDATTRAALLDTLRESLAVPGPEVGEVGLEAAVDIKARNLVQIIDGHFSVVLLPADDIEAPGEEPTEPLRGRAQP